MAKYYGKVGYVPTVETKPGVWRPQLVEKSYYGDVLKLSSRWQSNEHVNDDISVGHRISIVADAYAYQNFPYIKYVEWLGTRWNVTSVEVERPRIILLLGGVYSGGE